MVSKYFYLKSKVKLSTADQEYNRWQLAKFLLLKLKNFLTSKIESMQTILPTFSNLPSSLIAYISKFLPKADKISLASTCSLLRRLFKAKVMKYRIISNIPDLVLRSSRAVAKDDLYMYKLINLTTHNDEFTEDLVTAFSHKSMNCIHYLMSKIKHPSKDLLTEVIHNWESSIQVFDFAYHYLKPYGYFSGKFDSLLRSKWDDLPPLAECYLSLHHFLGKKDEFINKIFQNHPRYRGVETEVLQHFYSNKIDLSKYLNLIKNWADAGISKEQYYLLKLLKVIPETYILVEALTPDYSWSSPGHDHSILALERKFPFLYIKDSRRKQFKIILDKRSRCERELTALLQLYPEKQEQIRDICSNSAANDCYSKSDYEKAVLNLESIKDLDSILNIIKNNSNPDFYHKLSINMIIRLASYGDKYFDQISSFVFNIYDLACFIYYFTIFKYEPTVEQLDNIIDSHLEVDNYNYLLQIVKCLAKLKSPKLLDNLIGCGAPYLIMYYAILNGAPISAELEAKARELTKPLVGNIGYNGTVEHYLLLLTQYKHDLKATTR